MAKIIRNYLKELDLNIYSLVSTTDLDKKIKAFDTKTWREEIGLKTSLTLYIRWKTEIKEEEKLYGNGLGSAILFRAPINTLDLQWRKRINHEETTFVPIRGRNIQTLYFGVQETELICVCPLLSKPLPGNTDDIIQHFLLFQIENEEDIMK